MAWDYCVLLNDVPVGEVRLTKEGLYYIIQCRISLIKPGIYRLWAQTGEQNLDLGICVPYGSYFGLQTRIAVKKTVPDRLSFILKECKKIQYITVSENQPFLHIQQLEKGKFYIKDGKPCIALES